MIGQLKEISSDNAKLGVKIRWGVVYNGGHSETVYIARKDSIRMSVYKNRIVYFIRNEGLIPKDKNGTFKFAYNICLKSKLKLIWM